MVKVNLTDEDMTTRKSNNYFEEGVHQVIITNAERGETTGGKEYVEFSLLGQEDQEGTARLWFTTEKSAKYALSVLAGIAVHNKETEEEKQKVREAFKKITDTDQVDNKFLDRFKNMDAWYSVYKSDRTYTAQDGSTKNSYDKNIHSYQPKPKAQSILDEFKATGEVVSTDEIPFE